MDLFLPDLAALFDAPLRRPDMRAEDALQKAGYRRIAGTDEAGRGPLCGPVVAAAVVLDPARPIDGLADSKMLSEGDRDALFTLIAERADVGIALSSPRRIDAMNILQASLDAMARAVAALPHAADFVLIDGNRTPQLAQPSATLVKGDQRSASIAAASIVAKVVRDRLMIRLDAAFPGYGLAGHKGYPTAAHRAALARLGPTPHHRTSFKGVCSSS
ncbi:MAG: ribonuclease HII [Hyphomicrobiaceae bacterium]|nr:ribonuclease HII [Hyphomicrobiaceae bacterium]